MDRTNMIMPETVLAGRYRLLSRLGSGGHGEVWRARDILLDRVVAVKTVRSGLDGDAVARFHAEARAMATVEHPGVVGVFDYGIADVDGRRTPYLVMKYLDGEPLHLLLERRGRISAGATLDLVAQTAEALQAAHDNGVVHRDVKPANLIVKADGSVVLTDFGIARAAEGHKLTASGIVLGTATYCAPEQAEGAEPSAAMDVYALGVVAYECLAGRPPFRGENAVAIALQHVHDPPQPLPGDVPAAVAEVVMRALAKDPAARWPSAAAMAAAARALSAQVSGDSPLTDGFPVPGQRTETASAASPRDGAPETAARPAEPQGGAPDRAAGTRGGAGAARGPAGPRGGGAEPAGRAADGTTRARARSRERAGSRKRAAATAGALAGAAIAAAAAWALLPDDARTPAQAGAEVTAEASRPADPTPDFVTNTKEPEPSETPKTSRTTTSPSPEPADPTPTPTEGAIVGGIRYAGASAPKEYQPGLVEVFNDKGKRVTGRRADRDGYRFSLLPGGYRLQTLLGGTKCWTLAKVKADETTKADLTCRMPKPEEPPFLGAAVRDAAGDARPGGPGAGTPPAYADLTAAVAKGGEDSVRLEWLTGGAVPAEPPAEGAGESRWTATFTQSGESATVTLTGAKGAWTVVAFGKEVTAKPAFAGTGVAVTLDRATLESAPIDLTKPYEVSAAATVTVGAHTWTDTAP
ncbi:protein kinase [Nonomuraea sp. N2-4H]|uniref:serine/threonine-protein kinase n=1 Tax=Nonomuraea sp. N2-4H TaxID=3128898 RepID=UPI00324D4253